MSYKVWYTKNYPSFLADVVENKCGSGSARLKYYNDRGYAKRRLEADVTDVDFYQRAVRYEKLPGAPQVRSDKPKKGKDQFIYTEWGGGRTDSTVAYYFYRDARQRTINKYNLKGVSADALKPLPRPAGYTDSRWKRQLVYDACQYWGKPVVYTNSWNNNRWNRYGWD